MTGTPASPAIWNISPVTFKPTPSGSDHSLDLILFNPSPEITTIGDNATRAQGLDRAGTIRDEKGGKKHYQCKEQNSRCLRYPPLYFNCTELRKIFQCLFLAFEIRKVPDKFHISPGSCYKLYCVIPDKVFLTDTCSATNIIEETTNNKILFQILG